MAPSGLPILFGVGSMAKPHSDDFVSFEELLDDLHYGRFGLLLRKIVGY